MITTINENGLAEIRPETPLEAYALSKWSAENFILIGDVKNKDEEEFRGYFRAAGLIVHGRMNGGN